MDRHSPTPRVAVSLGPHRRLAFCIATGLCVLGVLAVPFGQVQLPASATFMPAFGTLIAFTDILTAILLFRQAQTLDDRQTAYLGAAYLVSALAIIPHMLAFPGAVTEAGVIGTSASAVWLWCLWHAGFALCVCRYALTRPGLPLTSPARLITASVVIVLGLAAVAVWGQALLPVILVGGRFARLNSLGIGPFVVACNLAALALVVVRLRGQSVLALWLSIAMLAATLDVALTLFGGGRFTVGWYAARCLSLATGITILVALLSELMSLFRQSEAANRKLQILSLTDGLTGIANRRSFDETLTYEWRRGAREHTPLSLLVIDIDFFKGYNDRYGHPAGDECLRQVSQAISDVTRRVSDSVARIGGEEFAMLLPLMRTEGAAEMAARIHAEIAALAIRHEGSPFGRVSISLGHATLHPNPAEMESGLVALADAALYQAKSLGRNRTERAAPLPEQDQHRPPGPHSERHAASERGVHANV